MEISKFAQWFPKILPLRGQRQISDAKFHIFILKIEVTFQICLANFQISNQNAWQIFKKC